jgi:hypothetical protein
VPGLEDDWRLERVAFVAGVNPETPFGVTAERAE